MQKHFNDLRRMKETSFPISEFAKFGVFFIDTVSGLNHGQFFEKWSDLVHKTKGLK